MVYVDPKNLGYKPYWQKWVSGRSSKQEREDLNRLYEKYVPALIDMVVEGIQDGKQGEKLKTIVPLTNLNMVGVGGVGCVCVCMCVCMHMHVCVCAYVCVCVCLANFTSNCIILNVVLVVRLYLVM